MKLVIFDCDGTLVDSQHLIISSMTRAYERSGLIAPARTEILSIVGLSLPYAVMTLSPELDRSAAERISEAYKDAFAELRSQPGSEEPLYPGIRQVLATLRERAGVRLGIATGKSRRGVDRVLKHRSLEGIFETIHTADDHRSKPDPHMIEAAIENCDATPTRTIMIGDTTFDMEMARAAGAQAIGVAWGYHPTSHLERAGAHTVAHTAGELADQIATLHNAMDQSA